MNVSNLKISPKLQSLLRPQTRVCVLTGAGVSQESGVPTFRDKDGLWQKFRPEELASMAAFLANPDLVTEWYDHRRQIIRDVKPNEGHRVLAKMEEFFEAGFTLVTQNVDSLHRRAGSKNVLEVHGNILRTYCVSCQSFADPDAVETPRVCGCGGRLRPDVVWFGEMLPADIWQAALDAAERCDLFLTIGTSAAVYPAAGLPLIARQAGAYVVEINPVRTEISDQVDEILTGPAARVLPELKAYM